MFRKPILFSLHFFLCLSLYAQIPAGYYSAAEGKTEAALKTQLSSIISAGYIDKGYDGLYEIYRTSDNLPSGKVWDMYSIKSDGTAAYFYTHSTDKCGSYSGEGSCYNREHTFCDSWLGAASPQRSDAHHLIPTDGYVNNRRGSLPHGKVGSATWTSSNGSKLGSSASSTGYSGTVFEPIDEFKGDFARMYFYVATRYESKIAGWVNNGTANQILSGNAYPAYKLWFYTLMLQWNSLDPVSPKEITRNNAIAVHQKNRNPFIDHPELAEFIWGNKKGQPWYVNGGSYPYLSTPEVGATVNFGKVAYMQTATSSIQVKAANLTGDLSFSVTGANAADFSIAVAGISKAQAEAGYSLSITYTARTVGSQSAALTITGGGITAATVTLSAVSSDDFIALAASNVSSTGFTANWTQSASATGYSLDVYTLLTSGTTQARTLLEEEFNSGLTAGWTSEGYTDNQTNGNMRLASGSNPGKITTPSLDLLQAGTVLTVRARQYSSDAGAVLTATVDNSALAAWTTGVSYQDFNVTIPAATGTSRIALSAVAGKRVYVDYVKVATQGNVQTAVSVPGYPKSVGNVLNYVVADLLPDSLYNYKVTPKGNQAAASTAIQVRTRATATDVQMYQAENVVWSVTRSGIRVTGVSPGSMVNLYDITGRPVQQQYSTGSSIVIPLERKGIYILQINNKVCKIIF